MNEEQSIPDENTMSLIMDRKIYYAAPASFNDPFDCNLSLHLENTSSRQWKQYARHLMDQHPQCRDILQEFIDKKAWKSIPINIDDIRDEIYRKSSVLCLSSKGDSIPMFSYYADNHRGVAVEISFAPQETPCGYSLQEIISGPMSGKITSEFVQYLPEAPELNYLHLRGTSKLVKNTIFTKFIEWQHEKEFRIFRNKIEPSTVKLEDKMITRIIFGERASDEGIKLVKKWTSNYKSKVILSKAKKLRNAFKLTIEDFE